MYSIYHQSTVLAEHNALKNYSTCLPAQLLKIGMMISMQIPKKY
jgi:hypothetical protein